MDFFTAVYDYCFSYTGMGAIGFMLCILVSMMIFYKCGLYPVRFLFIFLASVVPVYLGAKLFGIVSLTINMLQSGVPLFISDMKNAGIVYYGGMLFYLAYMRLVLPVFYKKKLLRVMNYAALLIPLFHGFARVGCYCAHCCYGIISDLKFFSFFYEHRIPVQLMEACFEIILFIVLSILLFRRKLSGAPVARVYLLSYSVFRFLIEFLRGDTVRGIIGPFSFSQWISIGIILYLLLTHCKKKGQAL